MESYIIFKEYSSLIEYQSEFNRKPCTPNVAYRNESTLIHNSSSKDFQFATEKKTNVTGLSAVAT
jgi:hypothetical protein